MKRFMEEIKSLLVVLVSGVVAGAMNSVAGGGTTVTYPALLLVGMGPVAANATSTVALLAGILGSIGGYRRQVKAIAAWLVLFLPVSLAGGLAGGIVLTRTPDRIFALLAPFLILAATVLFLLQKQIVDTLGRYMKTHPHGFFTTPRGRALCVVFQFLISFYGGYFGAGIGIMMLASLGIMGVGDIHRMNALKVVLAFAINVVAAAFFVVHGIVDWAYAGVMALGAVLGGYIGSSLAQRIPPFWVRRVIAGIGLGIAAWLLVSQMLGRG